MGVRGKLGPSASLLVPHLGPVLRPLSLLPGAAAVGSECGQDLAEHGSVPAGPSHSRGRGVPTGGRPSACLVRWPQEGGLTPEHCWGPVWSSVARVWLSRTSPKSLRYEFHPG